MGFEQAAIKVEKQQEFGELKAAIERAFRPQAVESFLKKMQGKGIRIRDFDSLVRRGILDDGTQELYQSLAVSDRAQLREFYLSRVEEVEPRLRTKFHKIYQYY